MRRSLIGLIVLLVASGVLLVACSRVRDEVRDEIRGSGNLVSESRTVSGFDRIDVSGQAVVHVAITGTESLQVEAEDNILDVLRIEVNGGRLELGVEPFTNIDPTREITYTITVAALRGVEISGSGMLDVATLDADAFEVEISGSGTVTPTGTATSLDVAISGSGRYLGADLASSVGTVEVSGSGEAVVNVADDLSASVSGSGAVRYLGDPPRLDTSISGSGSISRR